MYAVPSKLTSNVHTIHFANTKMRGYRDSRANTRKMEGHTRKNVISTLSSVKLSSYLLTYKVH